MSSDPLGLQVRTVDVLIAGGGPVGLITSYILLKAGLDVLDVEQYDKQQQAMYGRACMLYPRSLEILDQLGLYDAIAEIGYTIKGSTTYRGREEFSYRGWAFIFEAMKNNTNFDYAFSIRQKYSEEAFRKAILSLNSDVLCAPAKLLNFTVDSSHEHPVLSEIEINGIVTKVRSKYLVGADGGRSTVRSLANIPFPGVASPFRWIRLDAVVRTDMPASRRGGVAIESESHGNILWTPTDNGRTRIGFICPSELYGENGECITAEIVMEEARKAVEPFFLEFVTLDWWTVYAIGQRVADTFRDGPIILAGDAGHTHSSGAAQGMNTGIHDASNLGWKLAGVLKGWYTDAVLDTYATERRASAQQLIQLDKDISSLISGVIPAHFNASPNADVSVYLDEVFTKNAAFTVGLGISYEENLINCVHPSAESLTKTLRVGHRAPDPSVFRPGAKYPKRLQEFTPNLGRFWVLVFPGGLDPRLDQPRLRKGSMANLAALRTHLESPESFAYTLAPAFEFLTIVGGDGMFQTAETLGGQPLGKALYDRTGEAYRSYGVDEAAGAIVVLRPDGIVGFIAPMGSCEAVSHYFSRFVRSRVGPKPTAVSNSRIAKVAMGEIFWEGSAEETQVNSTS